MSEQLDAYLTGLGVRLTAKEGYNANAPAWMSFAAHHWRVTLTYQGRRMSFWFYQGAAFTDPPTVGEVVESLIQDRSWARMTLSEYGEEFGWDSNTLPIHTLLRSLNDRFERVLGPDLAAIESRVLGEVA